MGLIFNPNTLRYEFAPEMPSQQMVNQPVVNNQGINWVQGEQSARAWMVAPGTTALLMDSECSKFYMKSADNSGMPKFKAYEYHEISNEEAVSPLNPEVYATKKEIDDLRAEIERLSGLIPAPASRKKEAVKDE